MAYTRTWDASYEATPADSTLAKLLGARLRDLKLDIRERLTEEHYYGSSEVYGGHKFGYGTTANRTSQIATPKVGMVWYNTDFGCWQLYNGSAWINAGDSGIGTTAARDALSSPPTNMRWFSTDEGFTSYYSGTAWVTLASKGLFHGRISYAGLDTITLGRGNQGKLRLEIDGILRERATDRTLDLTVAGDRQSGVSQTPSTWYYVYSFNNSGVLDFIYSDRAPIMDPASGKVGYHDGGGTGGSTSWRCIGAVFCNAVTNIQPFDYNSASGLWTFRIVVSAFQKSPGTGSQATYTLMNFAGNLPATARHIRINVQLMNQNIQYYYGHESLSGLTVSSNTTPNGIEVDIDGTSNNPAGNGQFDIAVDSTPQVAWGNVLVASAGVLRHTVDVVGWVDDLGLVS